MARFNVVSSANVQQQPYLVHLMFPKTQTIVMGMWVIKIVVNNIHIYRLVVTTILPKLQICKNIETMIMFVDVITH